MAVTSRDLIDAFPDLLKLETGDENRPILAPSSQENPVPEGIAFTSDINFLPSLCNSDLAVLVVSLKLLPQVKELGARATILSTKNPYLAMAKVNQRFFTLPFVRQPFHGVRIHPTAVIHPEAQIAKDAIIAPGVVIHEGVTIGARSFIGANTVIEAHVSIGEDSTIHPHVYIGHTTKIGNRVEIKPQSTIGSDGFGFAQDEKGFSHKLPHYGPLIIEDDVSIGANVNIDRGTFEKAQISRGTKIDNHCHFGHNVFVGENCLITAGFITAGSSRIGDRCVFAGRASLNGKTEICSDVTIGPLSGVSNDILKPGVYGGFPPIPMKDFLKSSASFASLPKMRKNITKILNHLGIKDEA
jgi:UDP-3-O-[3-hydroxymyristoyl] glucosamine N-acyltransferase